MRMQITGTTDGRYVGAEFDSADNPIRLAADVFAPVEKITPIGEGARRFSSTSYVIDAIEV